MLVPMKIDYGVRILVHLASIPSKSVEKGSDIARIRHIPENFMFQISNQLQEKKLLKSIRGPKGGFYLDKDPSEISIADVMDSLKKNIYTVSCIDNPEILHNSGLSIQETVYIFFLRLSMTSAIDISEGSLSR
jgi:Rrf2 family protein